MAIRRDQFEVGEWYHCFTRGVDKRIVFEDPADYERYLQLLYLCNSSDVIHRSNIASRSTSAILEIPRPHPLVGIGAYCLMANHPHVLVKEIHEDGISRFMQKLGTAYTMYFNIKYKRTGSLFVKPFRSKHVKDDDYFQRVVQYIHCNPAGLKERAWKQGVVRNMHSLEKFLVSYPYSSLAIHENSGGPLSAILDQEVFEIAEPIGVRKMLKEAREYYEESPKDFEW